MKFKIDNNRKKLEGQPIYLKDEYSFDFEPTENVDISLLVGYLTLGIDSETMQVRQVYGYNPNSSWTEKSLLLPLSTPGALILEGDIEPGVSKRLVDSNSWSSYYDRKSGWICIGSYELTANDKVVEFANETIAVVENGYLKSLWINPLWK